MKHQFKFFRQLGDLTGLVLACLREGDFEVLSNLHGRHLISREELQCFRRYGSVEALYAKVYGNLPLSEQQFYLVFPVQHMIHCGFKISNPRIVVKTAGVDFLCGIGKVVVDRYLQIAGLQGAFHQLPVVAFVYQLFGFLHGDIEHFECTGQPVLLRRLGLFGLFLRFLLGLCFIWSGRSFGVGIVGFGGFRRFRWGALLSGDCRKVNGYAVIPFDIGEIVGGNGAYRSAVNVYGADGITAFGRDLVLDAGTLCDGGSSFRRDRAVIGGRGCGDGVGNSAFHFKDRRQIHVPGDIVYRIIRVHVDDIAILGPAHKPVALDRHGRYCGAAAPVIDTLPRYGARVGRRRAEVEMEPGLGEHGGDLSGACNIVQRQFGVRT